MFTCVTAVLRASSSILLFLSLKCFHHRTAIHLVPYILYTFCNICNMSPSLFHTLHKILLHISAISRMKCCSVLPLQNRFLRRAFTSKHTVENDNICTSSWTHLWKQHSVCTALVKATEYEQCCQSHYFSNSLVWERALVGE
jgi:uncharacterized membrane protein YcfT